MPDRTTSKTAALAFVFLAAALLLDVPSSAQGRRDSGFGDLLGSDVNPLQQMGRISASTSALEGPVDPDVYLVGPGDLFDISVGGPQPVLVTLPVSADGFLMLPGAGAIRVAGRTLEEARTFAHASLREQYRNVRLEVTLAQPRQFYVHVSGAVPVPGRYLATPVARVATVLNIAFADTTQQPVSNTTLRPSLRNVRVMHRDGAEENVDILRYFSTGNPEHNPYLQDGDVISVPTYDPNYDALYVSGDVAFPGTYDFRPDDTLYDLLVLSTGQNAPDGFEQVRLARTRDDGSIVTEMIEASRAGNEIRLQPRDQIFVLPEETVRGTAELSGWVNFPGRYSIVPGRTTVGDLLELGGDPRPGALERGAFLERSTLPEPELEVYRQNRFEYAPRGMGRLMAADTLAILKNTRLAEMDFLSRVYLAQELRVQNRVPIDLEAVLQGDGPTILLQDGDRVHVPRDENSVFVFGQVNRPGYVAFEPGRQASHYTTSSGGLSSLAGKAYVIEAGTGRYLDASSADVQSGDMIFVDRAESRADTAELQRLISEERRAREERRSRTIQTVLQTVGTVTGIITMYLYLTTLK